jgi:hypothetical protein
VIDRFHILQTINLHQVVRRDVNPAGAEDTLTPRPEAFPAPEVHAMGDPKSETFEGRKRSELFSAGLKWKVSYFDNRGAVFEQFTLTRLTITTTSATG